VAEHIGLKTARYEFDFSNQLQNIRFSLTGGLGLGQVGPVPV